MNEIDSIRLWHKACSATMRPDGPRYIQELYVKALEKIERLLAILTEIQQENVRLRAAVEKARDELWEIKTRSQNCTSDLYAVLKGNEEHTDVT